MVTIKLIITPRRSTGGILALISKAVNCLFSSESSCALVKGEGFTPVINDMITS